MQFSKRLSRIVAAAITLGAVLFAVMVTPASAKTFEMWHFRDGQVCFQDHGWTRWPAASAVAKWNVADVNIVRASSCATRPRSMVIDLKTYNDPKDYACAKTASEGNDYSWVYVTKNGVRTASWAPNRMTIWMNMAPSLYARCHATAAMRAHLVSHELGHGIGVGHPDGKPPVSVMPQGSWSVQWPTAWDLANVNAIY